MTRTKSPPVIGTEHWWVYMHVHGKGGTVEHVLRLLEQETISRSKALELIDYATAWNRGGLREVPRAPWDELNWCDAGPADPEPPPTKQRSPRRSDLKPCKSCGGTVFHFKSDGKSCALATPENIRLRFAASCAFEPSQEPLTPRDCGKHPPDVCCAECEPG